MMMLRTPTRRRKNRCGWGNDFLLIYHISNPIQKRRTTYVTLTMVRLLALSIMAACVTVSTADETDGDHEYSDGDDQVISGGSDGGVISENDVVCMMACNDTHSVRSIPPIARPPAPCDRVRACVCACVSTRGAHSGVSVSSTGASGSRTGGCSQYFRERRQAHPVRLPPIFDTTLSVSPPSPPVTFWHPPAGAESGCG